MFYSQGSSKRIGEKKKNMLTKTSKTEKQTKAKTKGLKNPNSQKRSKDAF